MFEHHDHTRHHPLRLFELDSSDSPPIAGPFHPDAARPLDDQIRVDRYLTAVHRSVAEPGQEPDVDGASRWFRWEETPIQCFVREGVPPLLVVRSVLAENVDVSVGLLEELNLISGGVVTARVFYDQGWVVAQAEVPACGVTAEQLDHLMWSVGSLAAWADSEICDEHGGDLHRRPAAPVVAHSVLRWT